MQKRFCITLGVLFLMSLLGVAPLFFSSYPQMVDLPQHAAQITLLRNLSNPNFQYSHLFHVNWFTPYLFGYLLIDAFTSLLGIVNACKLVIALVLIAVPLTTGLLLYGAGIDIFWAILSIPGLYGFAYQWGLLNFLVAAPLGLLFLYFYIRYTQKPTFVRALLIGMSSVLLFFCHALVCAFFLLISACYAIGQSKSFRSACMCISPLFAVLPAAILWVQLARAHPATVIPARMDESWTRIVQIIIHLTGMHSVLAVLTVGPLLIVLPFLAGERFARKPAMWMPLCVFLATQFFLPGRLFESFFVYERFAIFALPCFLMTLQENKGANARSLLFRAITVIVVAGCIVSASRRATIFESCLKGFPALLSQMKPGQRALSLVFDAYDGSSYAATLVHIPSWYSAQKGGLVDPNFAEYYPELLSFLPAFVPRAHVEDFEWNPEEFNWSSYHGEQYRYFVVRSKSDRGQSLFSGATCPIVLRYNANDWWLYERVLPCTANGTGDTAKDVSPAK